MHRLGTLSYLGLIVWVMWCCVLQSSQAEAALRVEGELIRQDRYDIPLEDWQWAEGWWEPRQYFPRYFEPSATLHAFVRNTSETEVHLKQLWFNGQRVEDVTTNPDYAGAVIWHRMNPETLGPGEYGMVYVRLRHDPKEPIELGIETDTGERVSARFEEADRDGIRFGYVGFSSGIDRIYAYVENWTDEVQQVEKVWVDGEDVTARCTLVNASFKRDEPALIEIPLSSAWEYGSHHVIKAATGSRLVAMSQVRARDAFFYIGRWCGGGNYQKFSAKFFNTALGHPTEVANPESEASRYGFRVLGHVEDEAGILQTAANTPPGRSLYNGPDEPDARDARPSSTIEWMDRTGINAMQECEPVMRLQRRLDPHHDTIFVMDRTYAPMNWLHYGEMADIAMNDCYVPSKAFSIYMDCVPNQVHAVMDAVAPRPLHMILWAIMNTGQPVHRSPTPEENEMSVHYALAEGAKGLYYFAEWAVYPGMAEGGYYVPTSRTFMLWKNIGRMNCEAMRLSPLLTIGHPFQIAKSDSPKLYVRSLLCGKDNFVVIMVNRNHRIHGNVRSSFPAMVFPVKDATVEIKPPSWFKTKTAVQVGWDGAWPVALTGSQTAGGYELKIDELQTAMVVVLSQEADIAERLTVPPEQFAALLESELPVYVTEEPPIADVERPEMVVRLDEATLERGELTLDLTNTATLARACEIQTTGELWLKPGEWLGLMPPKDWHGDANIVFAVESDRPLRKVKATLIGQTPNFVACAYNMISLSRDGVRYDRYDWTFKREWYGGVPGESIAIDLDGEEEPISKLFVRVKLHDPGYVTCDQATNLAERVDLSWELAE